MGLDIISGPSAATVEPSVGAGNCSRGSNLACSGSLGSTISVVEVVLPKRLIFFARATREERRRSRTLGGGPLPPRESSACGRGLEEARLMDYKLCYLKRKFAMMPDSDSVGLFADKVGPLRGRFVGTVCGGAHVECGVRNWQLLLTRQLHKSIVLLQLHDIVYIGREIEIDLSVLDSCCLARLRSHLGFHKLP